MPEHTPTGPGAPPPPDTPTGPSQDALRAAVAQYYLDATGRAASEQEITNQLAGGNNNLQVIYAAIYNSPEAIAYAARGTGTTTDPGPGPGPTPPGPTPPPSAGGGAPAATDFDFNQARAKIERGIGRALTDADISLAFSKWGGSPSARFTDASIAPVIAYFKGGGTGAPGGPGSGPGGFGATPPPYQSDPNAPGYQPLPPYVRPEWTGGDFVNPTQADLEASPGYQARLDAGLQARNRSAAAQGTVLNGGTLKALDRFSQDYATNEYQTLRNNTYDAYKQRYSQFQDAAGMDLAARTVNANDANTTYQNRTAAYTSGNARTLTDYLTNLTAKRNSELDYWNRLMDLTKTGAGTATGSYHP